MAAMIKLLFAVCLLAGSAIAQNRLMTGPGSQILAELCPEFVREKEGNVCDNDVVEEVVDYAEDHPRYKTAYRDNDPDTYQELVKNWLEDAPRSLCYTNPMTGAMQRISMMRGDPGCNAMEAVCANVVNNDPMSVAGFLYDCRKPPATSAPATAAPTTPEVTTPAMVPQTVRV